MPAVTSAAIGIPSLGAKVAGFVSKFAGPLASFAGNLFGSGGDRSNLDRHFIARRVRDAQEAGIHPLYALGAGGGYSPTLSTGGSALGEGLRAAGPLLDRIRSENEAKASAGMANRIAEAQIRSLNASATRDETAAQVALAQMALDEQSLIAQNRDRINARLDEAILSRSDAFGMPPSLPPLRAMQKVVREDGSTFYVPNQEAMETGEIVGNAEMARALMNNENKPAPNWILNYYKSIFGSVKKAQEAIGKAMRRATAPRKYRSFPQYKHRR